MSLKGDIAPPPSPRPASDINISYKRTLLNFTFIQYKKTQLKLEIE